MKAMAGWAALLLLAGCGKIVEKHNISAVLKADLGAGNVSLTCRDSTSGQCDALFVTGDKVERLMVNKGRSGTLAGVGKATSFCLDETEPQDGCSLRVLADGEQIIRSQSSRTG